ncbi:YcbK family protein [Mesorhizobium sp. CAU 1732]|uniref:YcbK family protein n=1 Tax=Mesorhizobium sp. CAU 1732 TaxID=3140358 RepID=UPI003261D2CC
MKVEETRLGRGRTNAVLAALASVLLASCATSGSEQPYGFASMAQEIADQGTADFAQPTVNSATGENVAPASQYVMEEGDPSLPDAIASAPSGRPLSEVEAQTIAAAQMQAPDAQSSLQPQSLQAQADAILAQQAAQNPAAQPAPQTEAVATAAAPDSAAQQGMSPDMQVAAAHAAGQPQGAPAAAQGAQATQFVENGPGPQQQVAAVEPKKRGFLSSFFGASSARAAPAPSRPLVQPREQARGDEPAKPLVQLASTGEPTKPLVSSAAADSPALPGVRQSGLFEISRRSGIDDDSDIDLHEGDDSYQVASAAGLARLAPNGLIKQTENVDVACLKPSLVRVLKTVEQHYGKKAVVTSGYRNPDRNRKARGARNSLHMYCAAADVQVEGVSKWELAEYVRTMPGRGGVGTYCHTNSVHIDVGPERDWNWRCRRRK